MYTNIYFPKICRFGHVTLTFTSEDVSFPCLSDRVLYIILRWYKLSSLVLTNLDKSGRHLKTDKSKKISLIY